MMTMNTLKGLGIALTVAACLGLYYAMTVLMDQTTPGAGYLESQRLAYAMLPLLGAMACCFAGGLAWSRGSSARFWPSFYVSMGVSMCVTVACVLAFGVNL